MESVTVSVALFFDAWAQSASQSANESFSRSLFPSSSLYYRREICRACVRGHACTQTHLYGFQFTDISFNLSIIARIYQKIYIVSREKFPTVATHQWFGTRSIWRSRSSSGCASAHTYTHSHSHTYSPEIFLMKHLILGLEFMFFFTVGVYCHHFFEKHTTYIARERVS